MAFRRSAQRWGLFSMIGVFLLTALAQLPRSSYEDSFYGPDSGYAIGARIAYGIVAVACACLMARLTVMGIVADRRGLVVRNWFRTERARWDEVEGVDRPAPYGAFRRTGLRIEVRDRPAIHATLYSAGPLNSEEFADDVIAELEELRASYAPEA